MADTSKQIEIIISAKDQATSVIKNFGSTFKSMAQDAQAGSAIILGSLGLVAKSMIDAGKEMESAKTSFTTFLGSADQAGKTLKQLSDFAIKTPFDLPQVVDGSKRLLAMGIAAKDLVPVFNTLGDLSSGNKQKLDQLVLAYGQVKAATRLTGNELRQFTEAGIPLLDELGKQTHKSAAEMRDMVESGAISFDQVDAALKAMNSEGGKFFKNMESQSQTLTGVLSNTRDEFVRFSLSVLGFTEEGSIREGSIFFYIKQGAMSLLVALQVLRPIVQQFLDSFMGNTPAIIALMGALVGLMTPLLVGFVALIAPALAFAAAGAAIAFAISWVITNMQVLEPYFPIIIAAFTTIATMIAILVIPSFIAWAAAAISAAIATVIALAPVIAISLAIGAAVAVLYMAWKNNWLGIRQITQTVVDFFKNTVLPFFDTGFGKFILAILDAVSSAWTSKFKMMADAVMWVVDKIKGLISAAQDLGNKVKGGLKIPGFQHGGFVAGGITDAVPAILHGGERVIPRNGTDVNPGLSGGGSASITINFTGPVSMDSQDRVNDLAERISNMLGRQNELAAKGLAI